MSETRLKGQEVTLRLVREGAPESALTALRDITITLDMATLDEGYLGEKSNRRDEVYNGVSGSLTVVPEGPEIFTFIDFLKRRAQRDPATFGARINLTGRCSFPDGRVSRFVVRDLKFGSLSFNVPGRDQFTNVPLSWVADDIKIS